MTKSSAVTIKKVSDLTPDGKNANKGNPRGRALIEKSLRDYGAGRSILIDKNGAIIAGNKTAENAAAAGLVDVMIVKSDGTKLIAVQRTDLDLNDPKARELAIADNRASEVSLNWNLDVLKDLQLSGVDLGEFWSAGEIAVLWPASNTLAHLTLAERFGVPPFSVLDARQGYWQSRKKAWLDLGIQSELGRGGGSGTPPHPPTVTQNQDGTLNYGGTEGQAKRFDRQRQANSTPGGGGHASSKL